MNTVNVELFGRDARIQKAIGVARNVAVTKSPVLIVGEAGVGKQSLAYFIHQNSSRSVKPLKIVDCSMPTKDVENAILGHRDDESGRFNRGVLEVANGGTVVFSNIDCLEEDFQKKLHQIINQLTDYDIDVRIIATTTNNLSKLVGAGRFYRGLYTFICANQITLVPLRERPEDITYIAASFLAHYNQKMSKEITLTPSAAMKMNAHLWSKNIEELKNVIEISVESCESANLDEDTLLLGERKVQAGDVDSEGDSLQLMSLHEVEKLLIKKALIHTSENRTQAAKILGVSIRTLRNKINEYRTEGHAYFVNLR